MTFAYVYIHCWQIAFLCLWELFFFVTNFRAFSLNGILIVQGAFFTESYSCYRRTAKIVGHRSSLRFICYVFLWFNFCVCLFYLLRLLWWWLRITLVSYNVRVSTRNFELLYKPFCLVVVLRFSGRPDVKAL